MVDVILGLQWGDEGKGKIVDVLTPKYDIIARFQGGPNAGHTIEFDHRKFVLHTIPSGIFHPGTTNIIGNGVIIDPYILVQELQKLREAGLHPETNLLISKKAHLILPTHRLLDAAYEASKGKLKIGSTLKGIGPAYTDKVARNGLRIGFINHDDFLERYDCLKTTHAEILKFCGFESNTFMIDGIPFSTYEEKWFDSVNKLKDFELIDSEEFINQALDNGKSVLAEGAQGAMLDIDFGSYPFVTSSSTISAGVCSGLGVSPHRIGKIFGIFKSYCTRVGSGPFPTELFDVTGESLRKIGREFGSTTGRPRRCGWLDLPALRYSVMLNGIDSLIMMKADVLDSFQKIKVCTHYCEGGKPMKVFPFELSSEKIKPEYAELDGWNVPLNDVDDYTKIPLELDQYIRYIESAVGIPVEMISIGPDRTQTLQKKAL